MALSPGDRNWGLAYVLRLPFAGFRTPAQPRDELPPSHPSSPEVAMWTAYRGGLHRAERAIAERLIRLLNGTLPWPWIDPDKVLPWVAGRIGLFLLDTAYPRSFIAPEIRRHLLRNLACEALDLLSNLLARQGLAFQSHMCLLAVPTIAMDFLRACAMIISSMRPGGTIAYTNRHPMASAVACMDFKVTPPWSSACSACAIRARLTPLFFASWAPDMPRALRTVRSQPSGVLIS
jgi:hypothetical protein